MLVISSTGCTFDSSRAPCRILASVTGTGSPALSHRPPPRLAQPSGFSDRTRREGEPVALEPGGVGVGDVVGDDLHEIGERQQLGQVDREHAFHGLLRELSHPMIRNPPVAGLVPKTTSSGLSRRYAAAWR